MRKAVAFFGVAGLVACGARTALWTPEPADGGAARDAGADTSVRPRPDAAPVEDAGSADVVYSASCDPEAGPPGPDACVATLHVLAVQKSMPSCFVDVVVQEGDTATLEWDCASKGNARVVANGKTFVGRFDGQLLDVCAGTTFPWSDGCQWQSAQHFRGYPLSSALTFTYSEEPIDGGNCQPPCSAYAIVKVGP